MIKKIAIVCITFLFFMQSSIAQKTFTNPLLPFGPDPWTIYHDGFYYYMNSMGNRLELWKTNNMAYLSTATHTTIWTPPDNR